MRMRVPSKKIREEFLLIYELEGCQKAINYLAEYYRVRKMRIILDGRKVGNGDIAVYFKNSAYFTKRGSRALGRCSSQLSMANPLFPQLSD